MILYYNGQLSYHWGLILLLGLCLAAPVGAAPQLKQFKKAPSFDLPTLDPDPNENRITTAMLEGKPSILVFGELYNLNTIEALQELERLLEKLRSSIGFEKNETNVYLIVTQNAPPQQLRAEQIEKNINVEILHDTSRSAFGAYGIVVLPSFYILDRQGNISMKISGYPLTFADMMTDAILFS